MYETPPAAIGQAKHEFLPGCMIVVTDYPQPAVGNVHRAEILYDTPTG
jgi:hypothetical protein